ncbi:MAG: type II CAAX endopeptidase family protein [Bacteroidota bacterium]
MDPIDQPTPSNQPYPSTGQSFVLLLICIGFTLVFGIVQAELSAYVSTEAAFLIMYLLTFGATLLVGLRLKRRAEGWFQFSVAGIPLVAYPILYLVTINIMNICIPLTELVPMPEEVRRILEDLIGSGNVYMFLAAVIAAPIFEELIFRGVILNGLLRNYNHWYAIALSSFLFGIAHLNPWQFIVAFLLGLFLGWVYYRTQSLIACILIHFFTNGTSFTVSMIWEDEATTDAITMYGGSMTYLLLGMLASVLMIAGSIYVLDRLFQAPVDWHQKEAVPEVEGIE